MTQTLTASETVAARLKAVRNNHGWTQEKLAGKCRRAGAPGFTRQVIADIESGRRRDLGIDDLLLLASVLGVNPLHLFAHGGRISIGRKSIAARRIRQWVRGERPLREADAFTYLRETPNAVPHEIRFDRELGQTLKRQRGK